MDDGSLNNYMFKSKSAIQYKLAGSLTEISGLASVGSRIFAITDEVGKIYELDINSGKIIKKFFLGRWTVEADFEGLVLFNDVFAAVTSNGSLYFFNEGSDGEAVDYDIVKTGLKSSHNVEGLCFDENTNSLLLACKDFAGKGNDDNRAVYSFNLDSMELDKNPRFMVSLKKLKKKFDIKNFHPSGIVGHPESDSFLILYSKGGPGIVEVSAKGDIIGAANLKSKIHRQPEGIALTEDGVLIIADEGAGKSAALTKYYPNSN
jgi:uncharacterized protein YjiK